jgi:glycerophosphoryl diester phosphodiesterase
MPEIFAHRGVHATERENTLGAFRAARALGVTGVELDVRRTGDGQFVIHHDPRVGGIVIAQSPKSALPSYVPTLHEALDELVGLVVNVELKNLRQPGEPTYDDTGTFARDVVSLLDERGWAATVLLSCFDLATCEELKKVAPGTPVGWLLWLEDLSEAIVVAHDRGLDAVNPQFRKVTHSNVDRAHSRGLEVNVWTVNEPGDIVAVAAMGADRIITDQPALALSLVRPSPFSAGH